MKIVSLIFDHISTIMVSCRSHVVNYYRLVCSLVRYMARHPQAITKSVNRKHQENEQKRLPKSFFAIRREHL